MPADSMTVKSDSEEEKSDHRLTVRFPLEVYAQIEEYAVGKKMDRGSAVVEMCERQILAESGAATDNNDQEKIIRLAESNNIYQNQVDSAVKMNQDLISELSKSQELHQQTQKTVELLSEQLEAAKEFPDLAKIGWFTRLKLAFNPKFISEIVD